MGEHPTDSGGYTHCRLRRGHGFTLAMYIPVFVKMNREAKADAEKSKYSDGGYSKSQAFLIRNAGFFTRRAVQSAVP